MLGRKMESERAIEALLTESDRQALNEMRKGIYVKGLEGGAAGFLAGVAGFKAASHIEAVKKLKLERKHAFATPLVTFALGMMVGSMVAARNHSHTLHYIVQKYSTPELTPYQERAATFKELGSSLDPAYDKGAKIHDHEAHLDDPLIKFFRDNDAAASRPGSSHAGGASPFATHDEADWDPKASSPPWRSQTGLPDPDPAPRRYW